MPAAGLVRRWLLLSFESHARTAVAHASLLRSLQRGVNEIMFKRKMKSWMVTRVVMWLLCEHSVEASTDWSICHTFYPFINQHHDADALHRRTTRSPDATLLKQAGWHGLLGFDFSTTGQLLCIQNVTHACLFAKCTTHLKPKPWENLPGLGQQFS